MNGFSFTLEDKWNNIMSASQPCLVETDPVRKVIGDAITDLVAKGADVDALRLGTVSDSVAHNILTKK